MSTPMPARPSGVSGDTDEFTARIAEARGQTEISPWDAGAGFLLRVSVRTVGGALLVRWHEALPHAVRHVWAHGLPTCAERLTVAELAAAGVTRRPGYASAAVRAEVQRVLDAAGGGRDHALNSAAFALGQLAAAGLLPRDLAENALARAGLAGGLGEREIAAAIRSGPNRAARPAGGEAA